MTGRVISVSRSDTHSFSKNPVPQIVILAGLGVEGDAHAGEEVMHRYLVRKNPNSPNLAQVHLLQSELFRELRADGLEINAGEMGENVTTEGVNLLELPLHTKLHLGATAVVQVTGLRTPCIQMDQFRPGLKKACTGRDSQGGVLRKAGIMGIALVSGMVHRHDEIRVELPPGEWVRLGPV